jgi:release factor glutamine methyltransferase
MTIAARDGSVRGPFRSRTAYQLPRSLFRLPGVYRPQADTHLLAEAAGEAAIPRGARVLDAYTGSGALAVAAAQLGAGEVTAVDVSLRAVWSAWVNGRGRGLPVRASRASFTATAASGLFDVVLANPPYVPCPRADAPTGRCRAWDAGPNGRALLDPLCLTAPALLTTGGFLLLVHSEVAGVDSSLEQLRAGGLRAEVVARARTSFGPVMRARAAFLERAGLIEPGQCDEELVVIRADRN